MAEETRTEDVATSQESPSVAWRNVAVLTLLFCVVFALPNFVVLLHYLPTVMDVRTAAVSVAVGFALSGAVLLLLIVSWLRRSGRALRNVGWGTHTTISALVVGVLFAIAWLGLSYANHIRLMPSVSLTEVDVLRLVAALAAVFGSTVEEIGMRGVVMAELNRAKVRPWLQVLLSGFGFGVYHSLHMATSLGGFLGAMIASTIMGCALAGIYVLGKRSLTAPIISHGLINLLGEPYLLMAAIEATRRFG